MNLQPKLKPFEKQFKTIDSHTMGEATRIIYDGFPPLEGNTMMERKKFLEKHYDHYRTALMLEPRGHRDMFGALLTDPIHEEADLGVIFMDSGGYLNMCGHGSIGVASMAVETGLVEVTEPYTEVVLDAPSGIIRTKVKVEQGKAIEVSILNVPAFLYKQNLEVDVAGYGTIPVDIAFGGSFFALVDADKMGLEVSTDNIELLTDLGMKLIQKINQTVEIKHPYLDIVTVDLAEFYCAPTNPKATKKNVVIFGEAQADRSPCGTGTSAKLATLYTKGELGIEESFIYESITGSMFRGEVVQEIEIDGFTGIIPRITGSAYITGLNTWILDDIDPLEMGFLFGKRMETPQETSRSKIVKAAWQLFHDKGFAGTTEEDIIREARVSKEEFQAEFENKNALTETLDQLFDQRYAELIVEMNPRLNHYEKLLFLNRELFDMIQKRVPVDMLAHMYSSQMEGAGQKSLMSKDRLYYKLLDQIFQEGQSKGEFTTANTYGEMSDMYATLERGLLYDWCVKDGGYDLTGYSQKMMPMYLKEFLK